MNECSYHDILYAHAPVRKPCMFNHTQLPKRHVRLPGIFGYKDRIPAEFTVLDIPPWLRDDFSTQRAGERLELVASLEIRHVRVVLFRFRSFAVGGAVVLVDFFRLLALPSAASATAIATASCWVQIKNSEHASRFCAMVVEAVNHATNPHILTPGVHRARQAYKFTTICYTSQYQHGSSTALVR